MSQKYFEIVQDGVVKNLTSPEKLVLLTMAYFADAEGRNISVSRTRMASMARISESAVDKITLRLLAGGAIEREGCGADTKGHLTRFRLRIKKALDLYGDKPRAEAGPSRLG